MRERGLAASLDYAEASIAAVPHLGWKGYDATVLRLDELA